MGARWGRSGGSGGGDERARTRELGGGGGRGGRVVFFFIFARARVRSRGESRARALDATRRGAARDRGSPGGRTLCCPRFCVRACSTRSNRPHWSWYPPRGFLELHALPAPARVLLDHPLRHGEAQHRVPPLRVRLGVVAHANQPPDVRGVDVRVELDLLEVRHRGGGEWGSPAGARGELEENVSFVTPSILRAWAARRETGYRS